MEKIKLAIIGLGGIVQVMHLPAILKRDDIEITALCDVRQSKIKDLSKKLNVSKTFTSADEMLASGLDIDAALIAAPTDYHADISIKCLRAGINVLVEKPLGRNLREAKMIVDEANKSGKILMVGMNNRFRSDSILQRSFLRSGDLGEVYYVKTGWLKRKSSNTKWFTESDKSGGGVVIDNGIVMLDLGMWMMDFPDVKSVSAVNYSHNTITVEDSSIALIKFKSGASMTMEVSWSFHRSGEFFYCNAFGREGSTFINPLRIFRFINNELKELTPKNSAAQPDTFKDSYDYQIRHFAGSVKGYHKSVSTGEEALKIMEVIDAIYKSAKTGKEVLL
ncbi:MAG TPA: Gfo/Idh/MocA family oxidoreductase [Ignavibacteria bacterium]|nr:Gfo/Idh/MocA family oxidoreductase [Ignavibacteria bacterium]